MRKDVEREHLRADTKNRLYMPTLLFKAKGGATMHQYICEHCNAHLDPGERCDCQKVEIIPDKIPETVTDRLARPLIDIVAKAFEDPKVVKEYGRWKKERQEKLAAH